MGMRACQKKPLLRTAWKVTRSGEIRRVAILQNCLKRRESLSALIFPVPQYSVVPVGPIVLADINGDGNPDLLTAVGTEVMLGNGDGTFHAPQKIGVSEQPASFLLSDVNGDGKPDVILANVLPSVGVLIGNGNGTFRPEQTFATRLNPGITVVDVNGDGKPDLVVTNNGSNSISILLGNGNGTFQPQRTFATAPPQTPWLSWT